MEVGDALGRDGGTVGCQATKLLPTSTFHSSLPTATIALRRDFAATVPLVVGRGRTHLYNLCRWAARSMAPIGADAASSPTEAPAATAQQVAVAVDAMVLQYERRSGARRLIKAEANLNGDRNSSTRRRPWCQPPVRFRSMQAARAPRGRGFRRKSGSWCVLVRRAARRRDVGW